MGAGNRHDISNPDAASKGIKFDAEFKNHVTNVLPQFLPNFEGSKLVDGWAGVDGITPDKRAIIDAPKEGPKNLIIATGFSGGGIRDSPIAGKIVRSLITNREAPFPVNSFLIDRFENESVFYDSSESLGSKALTE